MNVMCDEKKTFEMSNRFLATDPYLLNYSIEIKYKIFNLKLYCI